MLSEWLSTSDRTNESNTFFERGRSSGGSVTRKSQTERHQPDHSPRYLTVI